METQSSSLLADQLCQRFSLSEIQSATQNFDEALVIGRGGFGKVYKGLIKNTIVAIKRLHSMSNQGAPEFHAEVEMLSKLRHSHLVSLIGYCNEGIEMVLVYEYMPHGTLEDLLHKAGPPLSWLQRLKMCIGAARGLDYLHTGTGTRHGVIHRDVKSSNILLDENFAAKISDFGLAKIGPTNQTHTYVSTGVKGTFGYMDPSYFYTGKLTRKSDAYSFGVVLLEVLCGRPAVDTRLDEERWGLAPWAQDRIKEGKFSQIIDPRLKGQISSNCLKEFARIAVRCLHNHSNQRPTMAEIVSKLELIHSLQERSDLSAPEENFVEKLRSFFSPKFPLKLSNLTLTRTGSSEGESSDGTRDKIVNAPVTKEGAKADVDHKKVNVTVTTGAKADVDHKKVNATVTTEGAKADVGYKKVNQIIHFSDASSFGLEDILHASAEVINMGTFWTSYRVMMDSTNQLMVRRFRKGPSWRDDDAFERVRVLAKISHPNILAPRAYYYSKDETLYITDYIQNGSVASLLHSSDSGPKAAISWSTRKNIIVGVTRGLDHLHTKENIVHGYLKSRNVLLDKNYSPLLADVGFSQLPFDAIPNTLQNHAPELLEFRKANMSRDVYSLGLIMLELLTRKSTNRIMDGIDLPRWVREVVRKERTAEVFGVELTTESNIEEELVGMLELAMACVSSVP